MLIQLTQRQPGGATQPVLVNPDHLLRAEPAGGGTTLTDVKGQRLDVTEPPDVLLDLIDAAHDEGARRHARADRKETRAVRERAQKERAAQDAHAKARAAAEEMEAATRRHQQAALASAEHAKRLAREAGLPERQVTSNVTPEGVDLKHPAPQPHQTLPAAGAHAAGEARADVEREHAEGAEQEREKVEAGATQTPQAAHEEAAARTPQTQQAEQEKGAQDARHGKRGK